MELKRLLKQYFFSLVLILCLMSFFTGIVTVKEKTQYNIDLTAVETVDRESLLERISSVVQYVPELWNIKK